MRLWVRMQAIWFVGGFVVGYVLSALFLSCLRYG